jgi:hypothetical protein
VVAEILQFEVGNLYYAEIVYYYYYYDDEISLSLKFGKDLTSSC